MRPLRTALTLGVAAVALAGAAGIASAQIDKTHVMTVPLPDGSVEQIRYSGDTAPQVSFQPLTTPEWAPTADLFAEPPSFAMLDRISAEMGRQAAAMIGQAQAMQSRAFSTDGLMQADLGKLPAGVRSYSVMTTITGNGACTRSVELTSMGESLRPHVFTRTSGDCRAGAPSAVKALQPQPLGPPRGPGLVQASYDGALHGNGDPGLVHNVSTTF